jgi:hypothetical protein
VDKTCGTFQRHPTHRRYINPSLQLTLCNYSSDASVEIAEEEETVVDPVPAWIDQIPIEEGLLRYDSITVKHSDRGLVRFMNAIEECSQVERLELFMHCRYYVRY